MLIAATPCAQQNLVVDFRHGSFTSFLPSRCVRFASRADISANARVYEYTAHGVAENKFLEIKTLRPRRVPRC